MIDEPQAGKLVASRVYSARCFLCLEVYEIAQTLISEGYAYRIERCMRKEGWGKGGNGAWVCPHCLSYTPPKRELEEDGGSNKRTQEPAV